MKRWTIHGGKRERLEGERYSIYKLPYVEPRLGTGDVVDVVPVAEYEDLRGAAVVACADLLKAANQFAGLGFERDAVRFEEKAARLQAILDRDGQEQRDD